MTQELQARLYDVLRLVVGSDIAQPEEREFAFATAVELTKQYPFIGFEGPIETLPKKGTFDWALTMMRAQPGKVFTYGISQSEYHFDAESGGFEYLTDSAPWRVVSGWALSTREATDWREVAPNVEGPFDRDEAARLGDEFGIEFTLFGSVKHERFRHTHGSWRVQVGREWADASAWVEDLFTPVHNLAWAKWAMKQGVELVYNEGHRYRWANGEVEIRCDGQWGRSVANHNSWLDTEDWQVAK